MSDALLQDGDEGVASSAADEGLDPDQVDVVEEPGNEDEQPDEGAGESPEGTEGSDADGADDDEVFVVRVNGEEVEVTLDEALNSYMRQSDYTRKTQELAAERQRLASATSLIEKLQADPAGTISALQQAFGINAGDGADFDEVDPLEQRVIQMEQRARQAEEQARLREIQAEASAVITSSGLQDVTSDDLLAYAVENQIGRLDVAAQLLKAEQANKTAGKQRTEIVRRKRSAPPVEGGSARGRKTAAPAAVNSIRDAFLQAKSESA